MPLADPEGREPPVAGLLLARDVTGQRRAEHALASSRRQLAETQRVAQVGSWEWDLATDRLTVSEELCRILGIPPAAELTVERALAVVHPADLGAVREAVVRMRTDPTPISIEHRIVWPDGTVRTVLVRCAGAVDDTGRAARVVGTDQDITDRLRADAERRRLLGRLYQVQEGQDRRLAADLHDGHLQGMAAVGFKVEQTRLRLGAAGAPGVHELLQQVAEDLTAEICGLRRTIERLRPLVLDEQGLEAALWEEAKGARERGGLVACDVTSGLGGQRLDPAVETALFRVAQQALANVVDHAGARHALIGLAGGGDGVTLWVEDDGRGFDRSHVQVLGVAPSFGLIVMRERVEALGGRFRVRTAPGSGTRVEAFVPHSRPGAAEGAR
jgi:PAS domain S-box-containing protein